MMTVAGTPEKAGDRRGHIPDAITPSVTPRQSRLLTALLNGPVSRHNADGIAGASNSPEVVRQLRALGIRIDCERIEILDRDGLPSRPGIYHLCESSEPLVRQILKLGE